MVFCSRPRSRESDSEKSVCVAGKSGPGSWTDQTSAAAKSEVCSVEPLFTATMMTTRSLTFRVTLGFDTRSISSRSRTSLDCVPLVASRSLIPQVFAKFHRFLPTSPVRFATTAPTMQPDIKLYQHHICPFCNVTKSLLSYSKLDYASVEVNPLTKAELKPWSGEYKKVPIAMIDGRQVNGSENILGSILNLSNVKNTLEKRWAEEGQNDAMTMHEFQKSYNALLWTRFAIDDLAALLYPNICGSLSESYDAFQYVKNIDSFTALQRISIQYLGALAMHFAARKVKCKSRGFIHIKVVCARTHSLSLKNSTTAKRSIVDEKAALLEALDRFEKEGLRNGNLAYSSGQSSPDLGDITVFGVLYSVRGLKAHHFAIQSRGGAIKGWYDRMSMQVLGRY